MITTALLLFSAVLMSQNDCQGNWLSTDGNKLVDSDGKQVILAGVNWFGFETQNFFPHGIWSRDMKSVLQQAKEMGFNSFRIPWCNRMLDTDVTIDMGPNSYPNGNGDPTTGVKFNNLEEKDITKPIELLDVIVKWCQENDMKIILDNHSRMNDAFKEEKVWYTPDYSEERWISDWVFMANRYKSYDAVIGMDLNNEPHSDDSVNKFPGPDADWGSGNDATDWAKAAQKCGNEILKVNPNILIIVEGVQNYEDTNYWWGGNLRGVKDHPITLNIPNKLMYSPHEYGPTVYNQPWFQTADFPSNLPGIWEDTFNYINTDGISPLFVGELGILKNEGGDKLWLETFIQFIKEKKLHYTFWALNPNSGDTGGLLTNDWKTEVQWKLDYLKPILSNPIPNCSAGTLGNETIDKKTIGLNLFPNPTTEILNIVSNEKIQVLKIHDINGRSIKEITFDQKATQYKVTTSEFSSGLYVITLETKKGTVITKFAKN